MWFCRGWYSKWSDAILHVLALKRHAFLYGMFLTVKDAAIKKNLIYVIALNVCRKSS